MSFDDVHFWHFLEGAGRGPGPGRPGRQGGRAGHARGIGKYFFTLI